MRVPRSETLMSPQHIPSASDCLFILSKYVTKANIQLMFKADSYLSPTNSSLANVLCYFEDPSKNNAQHNKKTINLSPSPPFMSTLHNRVS